MSGVRGGTGRECAGMNANSAPKVRCGKAGRLVVTEVIAERSLPDGRGSECRTRELLRGVCRHAEARHATAGRGVFQGQGSAEGESEVAGDGQAQAVAFAAGLGGGEGGEEAGEECGVDAGAFVLDGDG